MRLIVVNVSKSNASLQLQLESQKVTSFCAVCGCQHEFDVCDWCIFYAGPTMQRTMSTALAAQAVLAPPAPATASSQQPMAA
jgi:hypothetical protein